MDKFRKRERLGGYRLVPEGELIWLRIQNIVVLVLLMIHSIVDFNSYRALLKLVLNLMKAIA
ncbi:MAG: hypothetical protein ACLSAF_17950 [Intestinimonas sp.]